MDSTWRVVAIQQNPVDGKYYATLMEESRIARLNSGSQSSRWDARDRMYDGCGPFVVDSSITLEINPAVGFVVGDRVRLKLEFAGHSLLTSEQARLTEPESNGD